MNNFRDTEEQKKEVELGEKDVLEVDSLVQDNPKSNVTPQPLITDNAISTFMEEYANTGMDAIRENRFSYIESYLDPQGKAYQESQNYIKYINSKNISEELLKYEVKDIIPIGNSEYKVFTYEEYEIKYEDGTTKIKSFNSEYLVKELSKGCLVMSELLKTDELLSRGLN
ncbi:TcaA NTF2-like domain-containing protein [Peribacillus tepidiphilus]|uniref:TcaA NTF2-like domain-containing protein n=1 Tax=Peribacillus tepidiphilus TaxID=2652445 RepID=UPI0035B524A5